MPLSDMAAQVSADKRTAALFRKPNKAYGKYGRPMLKTS